MDSRSVQFVDVLVLATFTLTVVLVPRHRNFLWTGGVPVLLIIVPALVVPPPFAGRLKDVGADLTLVFIVGYIATEITEEFWFRGIMLRTLMSWAAGVRLDLKLLDHRRFGSGVMCMRQAIPSATFQRTA
ncbi:MAG: hypothetical protein ABI238_04665 [Terrimesophilobacter sp.]